MIEVCKELYREELQPSFRGRRRQAETFGPSWPNASCQSSNPTAKTKPRSAPLKAPPPLKGTEGQEVKPVLIPLNDVNASKSVSNANDSYLSVSVANVSIGNDEQKHAGDESVSFCP